MNPLWLIWIIMTASVSVPGFLILTVPKWIPNSIFDVFVFGKLTPQTQNRILRFIKIPKRWFVHFYWFAALFNAVHLIIAYRLYIDNKPVPVQVQNVVDFLMPSRKVNVEASAILLSMLLFVMHSTRRLYECLFVSVYSTATINVVHYFLGFLFYFSVTETLLSEAPGFSKADSTHFVAQPFTFKWNYVLGVALYSFATVMHNRSHVALANLRKNNKGKVVTTAHVLPMGFWFEYVTCPHFLAEILIYYAIYTILGLRHVGWFLALCFVVSNQIVAAVLTHRWYQNKFPKTYPKKRKAIIPFVL